MTSPLSSSASVQETIQQINDVLKNPSNERDSNSPSYYSDYSCKTVSWDDVQRGTVGGKLSCWGNNITDTRLYAKDGRQLFTVRSDNWNERLGKVSAKDLALIVSEELPGGAGVKDLRPVTLQTVLKNMGHYGGYAGLRPDDCELFDEILDNEISVRFQTTFLPVGEDDEQQHVRAEGGMEKKTQRLEFAPEAYNYNTLNDKDPRNLILLCTTQGLAVQQDGKGAKKLFHHVVSGGDKSIKRYWLEAESSSHKVGGSQEESKEEKKDALDRGKATAAVIGTKAIGTRFNVLMTIQVPLQQQQQKQQLETCEYSQSGFCYGSAMPMIKSAGNALPVLFGSVASKKRSTKRLKTKKCGKSSAARVSRGSFHDEWAGLQIGKDQTPKRHEDEHVTATIVMYYTCSGGVPTPEDVKMAIDDLENLYQDLEVNGNLSDMTFMTSELTSNTMNDIKTKVMTQPPKPSCVVDGNIFPK